MEEKEIRIRAKRKKKDGGEEEIDVGRRGEREVRRITERGVREKNK